MKASLRILFFLCPLVIAAQHETHYWTRYAPQLEFKKWEVSASIEDRVAFEGGERRSLLANAVILRKLGDQLAVGAGFAHFTTYDNDKGGLSVPELRPFQQLVLKHESGRFAFDHRLRTEQRFQRDTLGNSRLDTYSYLFRARYRMALTCSIIKQPSQPGHFGIQLKNEIFLSAGNIDEHFDQNRLYLGFVYQLAKPIGLEAGYMWVNRNQIGQDDLNTDVIRITLRHDIDFK